MSAAPTLHKEPEDDAIQGREVILHLAAVLCDPKDNHSHAGKPYQPDDAVVRAMADTIEAEGLIHPIEVRLLEERIERDESIRVGAVRITHYTHKVVSGFKRFAALQKLKRETERFSEVEIDEDRALLRNGIENFVRHNPSDYETALYLSATKKELEYTTETLAKKIGVKLAWAESLIRIAERLPAPLLDIFRLSPTPEVRRDMDKIAKIERSTKEETHQAMIDAYAQLKAEQEAIALTTENRERAAKGLMPNRHGSSGLPRSQIRALLQVMSGAKCWYNGHAEASTIDPEVREFGVALLQYIIDPQGQRCPLR